MAKTPLFTKQPVKQNPIEIPPEDVIGPTPNLGDADDIFQILFDTIIGEQGIPEGVSPEVIEALRGDFGPTTIPAELQEVAIEIAEAGGFDEWLAQQPTGDPGDLFEPDTGFEEDTDFSLPDQVEINLEDFQKIYSSNPDDDNYLNPDEYMEGGTYTDPETGTVYVINIPPDLTDTEEDAGGGGGGDAGGDAGGDGPVKGDPVRQAPIDPERPWEYIGNGRFRNVTTGEIVTDPNYDPNNDLYEVGGVYSRGDEESLEPEPEPQPEPEPEVTPLPSVTGPIKGDPTRQAPIQPDDGDGAGDGDGDGAGDGDGDGDGDGAGDGDGDGDGTGIGTGAGGMLSPDGAFKPFMTSIGYTPVQLQQLIAPPKKDYVRELDGLIGRSLFGKMIK